MQHKKNYSSYPSIFWCDENCQIPFYMSTHTHFQFGIPYSVKKNYSDFIYSGILKILAIAKLNFTLFLPSKKQINILRFQMFNLVKIRTYFNQEHTI